MYIDRYMPACNKVSEAAKNEENIPVLPTGPTFPLTVAKRSCEKSPRI